MGAREDGATVEVRDLCIIDLRGKSEAVEAYELLGVTSGEPGSTIA